MTKELTTFVLGDGHQSRFDVDFLKYIYARDTKWNVCAGNPYDTTLWHYHIAQSKMVSSRLC